MLGIVILPSDIFDVQADAIVNPANRQSSMRFGSHINERIRREAGPQVVEERKEKGSIALGDAVYTSGGNLPFKYIVHAAILDLYDMNPLFLLRLKQRTSDSVLRSSTMNSLLLADTLPIESIAFSPMGAGIGGMSMGTCAGIMLSETVRFSNSDRSGKLRRAIFAVRNDKDRAIFTRTLDVLRS